MSTSVVLRVEHEELPGGYVEFGDEEVTACDVEYTVDRRSMRTQLRKVVVYEMGPEVAVVKATFRMARRMTLINLEAIRRLSTAFVVRPYYPNDTVSSFAMVWPDPAGLVERLRAGYTLGYYEIEVAWEEEVGWMCLPPS